MLVWLVGAFLSIDRVIFVGHVIELMGHVIFKIDGQWLFPQDCMRETTL